MEAPPDPFDQLYVVAPPALIVVELPEQMEEDTGVAITFGKAVAVTSTVTELVQVVAASVPVTVYVVIPADDGVTLMPGVVSEVLH